MRIAICFSGQLRTWEKCYPGWEKLFAELKRYFNADIDIFCHLWDHNSVSHQLLKETDYHSIPGILISEEEKERFLNSLKPISYLIENEEVNKRTEEDLLREGEKYSHYYGGCKIFWLAPQFYSVMRSSYLKKKYEVENNFLYDMCFRMRYDLYFDDAEIFSLIRRQIGNNLEYPIDNTVYPCYSGNLKMGDIFWCANSVTFDRICDFYKWMPFIGRATFPKVDIPGSELSLYFYAKMLRMNIKPLSINPKIYRPQEHLELVIKNQDGRGLEGCNIIEK